MYITWYLIVSNIFFSFLLLIQVQLEYCFLNAQFEGIVVFIMHYA